jgi:hypothetical protein
MRGKEAVSSFRVTIYNAHVEQLRNARDLSCCRLVWSLIHRLMFLRSGPSEVCYPCYEGELVPFVCIQLEFDMFGKKNDSDLEDMKDSQS